MTRVVLDPSTGQFIRDNHEYSECVHALAGSLYEGLASLMTTRVALEHDDVVFGLLTKLHDMDRDVWTLLEHVDPIGGLSDDPS